MAILHLGAGGLIAGNPKRKISMRCCAARDTERKVRQAVGDGYVPLVLGGDCTIELGTVAGHLPADDRIGLLYFDLHPDLNLPNRGVRQPAVSIGWASPTCSAKETLWRR